MKRIFLLLFFIGQSLAGWAFNIDSTKVHVKKDSAFNLSFSKEDVSSIQASDVLSEEFYEKTSNDSIQRYIDLAQSIFEKKGLLKISSPTLMQTPGLICRQEFPKPLVA